MTYVQYDVRVSLVELAVVILGVHHRFKVLQFRDRRRRGERFNLNSFCATISTLNITISFRHHVQEKVGEECKNYGRSGYSMEQGGLRWMAMVGGGSMEEVCCGKQFNFSLFQKYFTIYIDAIYGL